MSEIQGLFGVPLIIPQIQVNGKLSRTGEDLDPSEMKVGVIHEVKNPSKLSF